VPFSRLVRCYRAGLASPCRHELAHHHGDLLACATNDGPHAHKVSQAWRTALRSGHGSEFCRRTGERVAEA
jgi:hypothetical protein